MQIIATCPCGQQYNADSASVGTQLQCSTCGQVFVISASAYPQQSQPTGSGFPTENRYGQPTYPNSMQPNSMQPQVQPDPLQPLAPAQSSPLTPLQPLAPEASSPAGRQPAITNGQRSSSPRSTRSSKKAIWLSVGAGVAALVIVLLCFLFLGSSKPRNGMELTYLPSNLTQFYFIDLEKVQESAAGKAFLENDFFAQQHLGSVESMTQLPLEDIRSITVGYADPDIDDDFNLSGGMIPNIPNISFGQFFRFCGVIRTRNDYDKQKILDAAPMASQQEHAGHEYYLIESVTSGKSDSARGIAFPDSRTILFGSESELKKALTGAKAPNDSFFSNVQKGDQLVSIAKGADLGPYSLRQTGVSARFGDEIEGRIWKEFVSAKDAGLVQSGNISIDGMSHELKKYIPTQHAAQFQKLFKQQEMFGLQDVELNGNVLTTSFKGNGNSLVARGAMTQVLVGMLHRFSRFDSFTNPLKTSFTNRGNPKSQLNAMNDLLNKVKRDAEKKAVRNKKAVQPEDPRKQKVEAVDFNRLSRFKAGSGTKFNLLELFSPRKDRISGAWLFENEKLLCKSRHLRPRIQLPYKPPAEFDIKFVFSQAKPEGNISVILPNRGNSFSWILGSNDVHRFSYNPIKKNPTAIKVVDLVKPGQTHTLIVQKRRNSISAVFDGRVVSEYKGSFGDLKEDRLTSIKNKDLIGFCCETQTTLSEIELTEVSGSGSFVD